MASPHIFEIRRLLDQARAQAAGGDLEGARKAIRRALELEPDDVDLLCFLGRLELERGDLSAARAGYERSLAIDARHIQARYELAFLRIEERRFAEAEALLAGLVKDLPDSVESLAELAYLYRATGHLRRALDTYRRALDLDPGSPELLLAHAVALCEWGDVDQAHDVLQEALAAADGDTELRRAILRLLAELDRDQARGLKEDVHARHGAILLGTASDDGIDVPAYFFYHLDDDDVVTTAARLLAVGRGLAWSLDAVHAIDEGAAPIAHLLAGRLDVPVVASPDDLPDQAVQVLLVEGCGGPSGEARDAAAAAFSAAGAVPITLTVALETAGDPLAEPPDVIGVLVPMQGSLPWSPGCPELTDLDLEHEEDLEPAAEPRPPEDLASDLDALLSAALPEENLTDQVRYYAVQHHRGLRPHLTPRRGPVLELSPLIRRRPSREEALVALAGDDPTALAEALTRLEEVDPLDDAELEALLEAFSRLPRTRSRIDRILGAAVPEPYARLLMEMVETPATPEERRDGIQFLLAMDAPMVLEFLARCLSEDDEDLRFQVIGPGGWGALALLETEPCYADVVRTSLSAGGRVSDAALAWLRLRDDSRFVAEAQEVLGTQPRAAGRNLLGYLADQRVVVSAKLARILLAAQDPAVVHAACKLLEVSPAKWTAGRLARLVRTALAPVAGPALAALLRIRPGKARRALKARLLREGEDPELAQELCGAVARRGDALAAHLLASLYRNHRWLPPPGQEGALLAALCSAGDATVLWIVRDLLSRVDDPAPEAFDYVETYGDAYDEAVLIALLGGAIPVQYRAAATLCRIGRMDHLEVLQDGLECHSPERVAAACEAVAHVDGVPATRMLLAQLDRPEAADGLLAAFETWVQRRTLRGRLAALDSLTTGEIVHFLEGAFSTGLPDQRRRVLGILDAIGPDQGAPPVEAWLSPEGPPDELVTVLEYCLEEPSAPRAAAARRLLDHPRRQVASLAESVCERWAEEVAVP